MSLEFNLPISYGPPMMQALIEGRKTQTRRRIKLPKWASPDLNDIEIDPVNGDVTTICLQTGCEAIIPLRWEVGMRLWVKEALQKVGDRGVYLVDGEPACDTWPWKRSILPAMFLPRNLSRFTQHVNSVRYERLHCITKQDAIAEGLKAITKDGNLVKWGIPDRDGNPGTDDFGWPWEEWRVDPRRAYERLWIKINGAESWAENPYVARITFDTEREHVDAWKKAA
jgi:hypothetical protein